MFNKSTEPEKPLGCFFFFTIANLHKFLEGKKVIVKVEQYKLYILRNKICEKSQLFLLLLFHGGNRLPYQSYSSPPGKTQV